VCDIEIFKSYVLFVRYMGAIIDEQQRILGELFSRLKKEWLNVLGLGLLDVVFLLVYGFVTSSLFVRINNVFYTIGGIVSQQAPSYTQNLAQQPSLLKLLFFDPVLQPLTLQAAGLLVLILVLVYVLYVVFQGFSWAVSLGIAHYPVELWWYMKEFAKLNVLWFVLFAVYRVLRFASALRFTAVQQFSPESSINVINIVLLVLFLVVVYVAVISYVVGGIKKAVVLGRGHAKHIVPSFVIVGLYVVVADVLVVALSNVHSVAGIVAGVILLFPFFAVARVFLVLIISRRAYVGSRS
jgi:hypothetical protein